MYLLVNPSFDVDKVIRMQRKHGTLKNYKSVTTEQTPSAAENHMI